MKKLVLAFSAVLFTASLGLTALTSHQAVSAATQAAKTVSGEVVSVDLVKNEVVVKGKDGQEVRLQTDSATKVMRQGKEIALAEVKATQKITAEYEEVTGSYLAKSIRVTAGKAE